MRDRPEVLLADASVLIDYRDANPSVLALASTHLGPVRVVDAVLDEVRDFDVALADSLGIEVIDVPGELLHAVPTLPRRLTREDRLSFLTCREHDWVCLTNDRHLRALCTEHEVRLCWGLELMADLVFAGALPADTARDTANAIHEKNPRHISAAVLRRFLDRLP